MSRGHGRPGPHELPVAEQVIPDALRVLQPLKKTVKPLSQQGSRLNDSRLCSLAKHIHKTRAERTQIFGPNLFGEPAWDILLSLYVAALEGYQMKVSSVCSESGVPDTTALRWIEHLIELGLICRQRNPADNRSSFIELEEEGLRKMDRILDSLLIAH